MNHNDGDARRMHSASQVEPVLGCENRIQDFIDASVWNSYSGVAVAGVTFVKPAMSHWKELTRLCDSALAFRRHSK